VKVKDIYKNAMNEFLLNLRQMKNKLVADLKKQQRNKWKVYYCKIINNV